LECRFNIPGLFCCAHERPDLEQGLSRPVKFSGSAVH
jgi:hypothetical protein